MITRSIIPMWVYSASSRISVGSNWELMFMFIYSNDGKRLGVGRSSTLARDSAGNWKWLSLIPRIFDWIWAGILTLLQANGGWKLGYVTRLRVGKTWKRLRLDCAFPKISRWESVKIIEFVVVATGIYRSGQLRHSTPAKDVQIPPGAGKIIKNM